MISCFSEYPPCWSFVPSVSLRYWYMNFKYQRSILWSVPAALKRCHYTMTYLFVLKTYLSWAKRHFSQSFYSVPYSAYIWLPYHPPKTLVLCVTTFLLYMTQWSICFYLLTKNFEYKIISSNRLHLNCYNLQLKHAYSIL